MFFSEDLKKKKKKFAWEIVAASLNFFRKNYLNILCQSVSTLFLRDAKSVKETIGLKGKRKTKNILFER